MSVCYDFERQKQPEMNFLSFMTAKTIFHIYFCEMNCGIKKKMRCFQGKVFFYVRECLSHSQHVYVNIFTYLSIPSQSSLSIQFDSQKRKYSPTQKLTFIPSQNVQQKVKASKQKNQLIHSTFIENGMSHVYIEHLISHFFSPVNWIFQLGFSK